MAAANRRSTRASTNGLSEQPPHQNGDSQPDANDEYVTVGGRSLRARKPSQAALNGHDEQDDDGDEGDHQPEEQPDSDDEDVGPTFRKPKARSAPKQREDEEIQHELEDLADEDDDGDAPRLDDMNGSARIVPVKTLHGRQTRRVVYYEDGTDDDDDEDVKPRKLRRAGSSTRRRSDGAFVVPDEDYDAPDGAYNAKRTSSRVQEKRQQELQRMNEKKKRQREERLSSRYERREPRPRETRNSRRAAVDDDFDAGDEPISESEDDDISTSAFDDNDSIAPAPRRNLRAKEKVDYYRIPPLEAPANKNKGKRRQRDDDDGPFAGLPLNMTGAQWAALYPDKNGNADSSDDERGFSTPRKAALFSSNAAAMAATNGGLFAGGAGFDVASATPATLGKVNNAATLADTDPLGVQSDISFDSVGGLDSHVQQLKEMVSLPLLYPEIFDRFKITPPRGVLFHGPPGTGKTLLARALAASCSSEGRKISFFMRKGADCLSKWVGEAERQLRLLFEEAKNSQPSIIFFDEIDGLAPVRSSKQEQIHASIVSTLLALMDGMDGRGQVIVIGATNRPDAIDPALRRPGRFDREFYFPLPNREARRRIIDIHTSKWNPPLDDTFKDELAAITKGYGGADLRALCTEAALNAVQRRYPQIYSSNERLMIKPETISVSARDFIVSQQNLIPSSARATSSTAAPLPEQLAPLLQESLDKAKVALSRILPEVKKHNTLADAQFEELDGGFEHEKMLQTFESLRVFRPRMLICGEPGNGQVYVGAAILHHLEGYHVQTLDLATLVADSTRTMEAACVQLFVEAKRHKPSILFIPSLTSWCTSVGEAVRSTIKGLLDGLDPSDPILLLGVVDGPLSGVPADVRSWFGFLKNNRVQIDRPNETQREAFFEGLVSALKRPPNEYPDGVRRRKRKLEKLPVAPAPPPREPTQAEIQQQEMNDRKLIEVLKFRLGPVLNELKRKYKRFTRSYYNDWKEDDLRWRQDQQKNGQPVVGLGDQPYHNVDLDSMHLDLYQGQYFTPDEFLQDVVRIQVNVEINSILQEGDAEDSIKAGQMVNHTNVMVDQTFDGPFRVECARMSERMNDRLAKAPAGTRLRPRTRKELVTSREAIEAAAAAGGGRQAHEQEQEQPQQAEEPTNDGESSSLKRSRDDEDAEGEPDELDGITAPAAKKQRNGMAEPLIVPTTDPLPTTSALPVGAVMPPPMAVGAAPDSNAFASTSTAALGTTLPRSHSINALLSDSMPTVGSSSDLFSFENNAPAVASTSAAPSAPAVNGVHTPTAVSTSPARSREPSQMPVDSPSPSPEPEPFPDFRLSELKIHSIQYRLKKKTQSLTVDQLEQLRAALFDLVWQNRKEWDRDRVVDDLEELVDDFVQEVESVNADMN